MSIIGIILWLPAYLPNIHVDHRESEANEPFEISFTITNEGYFSVFDVYLPCRLNRVQTARNNGIQNIELNPRFAVTDKLGRGDTVDVLCPLDQAFQRSPDDVIVFADIDLAVTFTPRLLPIRLIHCAGFTGRADSSHHLVWMEHARSAAQCSAPMTSFEIPDNPSE